MIRQITKRITPIVIVSLALGITLSPVLYAMDAVNPAARNDIMNKTMASLSGSENPTELEPIRVRVREAVRTDEFLLARALHLYNQRRLNDAKGELKEVLIDNPSNRVAEAYLTRIISKIEAVEKPKQLLEEEIKGIVSVENAELGGNYGKEEFGNTDGQEKFTTNTIAIASKTNQPGEDWNNKYISEAMKLEGTAGDYKYTATANVNHYNKDNGRDDVRLRNATWWMKNDKVQFILGDTSSYLSRFILNGVNYRGANLSLNLYEDTVSNIADNFKVLYGKIPYFWLQEDEYIYPREIVAARNELDLWGWWELNTTFAYIVDNETRLQKINTSNKAKENGLLGFDQKFRLIPDVWNIHQETAFSYGDDDRDTDDKLLRGWANYLVSNFRTKTVKVYTSYERIEPNFRSFVGLTGFSANNQITLDREHFLNYIDYTPYKEIDFGLQYSKTRTNLAKAYDKETIEDTNYKANLKVMPTNGLPMFTLRGSIWTSNSNPGAVSSPKEQSNWDTVFEMAKNMWDTDLSTSYGMRGYNQYINETDSYGDALEHSFSLSASKKLSDRITVSPSYTYSRATLKKKPNRPIYTDTISSHMIDISMSTGLWDTAYFTLDYNLSTSEDFATASVWGTNNAFTTTFSWPLTTTLASKKLAFSPYLSYHWSSGTATFLDRTYFSGRVEGDYFVTTNSKINLSGEYRDSTVSDPTYVGYGDEYRIMLSYKTVNGF